MHNMSYILEEMKKTIIFDTILYCWYRLFNPKQVYTNLTKLHCTYNQLIRLPESICNRTNLIVLDCHANKLTTLPVSIRMLTNLTYLNCSFNKLTYLPDSIGNLT